MAALSLEKWTRYEPSIPGNAELPKTARFFLEVRTAMSTVEWDAYAVRMKEATTEEERLAVMASVVRMGSEPLTLDGNPVVSVAEYLSLALNGQRGAPLWFELAERFYNGNSISGAFELFCERPSGGSGGTPETTTGKAGSQTAAP